MPIVSPQLAGPRLELGFLNENLRQSDARNNLRVQGAGLAANAANAEINKTENTRNRTARLSDQSINRLLTTFQNYGQVRRQIDANEQSQNANSGGLSGFLGLGGALGGAAIGSVGGLPGAALGASIGGGVGTAAGGAFGGNQGLVNSGINQGIVGLNSFNQLQVATPTFRDFGLPNDQFQNLPGMGSPVQY